MTIIERKDLREHLESLLETLQAGDNETAIEWLRFAIEKLRDPEDRTRRQNRRGEMHARNLTRG